MSSIAKDPDAVLDYARVWGPETGANDGSASDDGWLQGDTIISSTWIISGPDADLVEDSSSFTDVGAVISVSGGTARRWYNATNHIVTAAGYQEDQVIEIEVHEL